MADQDIITRIRTELAVLEAEEVNLNHKYKNIYHLDKGSFDLLPELERVRKRRVELEDALRIMEEFKI